jgi:hypothetical protein
MLIVSTASLPRGEGVYQMTRQGVAILAAATAALLGGTSASAQTVKSYWSAKGIFGPTLQVPNDISLDNNNKPANVVNAGSIVLGFEGISQYDNASFARNFIPPDTNGAVGGTQYLESSNGAFAVFDKATGTRTQLVSDIAWWAAAGQTGANGDNRVMYNADAKRWIVVGFGANVKDLQIAISDTDNALGGWKSVKYEGFGGFGFGATADYPTLALDKNAVYIGTNNFAPIVSGGSNSFRGTTLNVIPIDSLFSAGAPTINNIKQFVTPYNGTTQVEDRGFAIQGVNSNSAGSTGKAIAASLFEFDSLGYTINGLSSSDATGATRGAVDYLGEAGFVSPGKGRQPATILSNQRIIDTLDERISSSVYEVNGRIYMLHTVNSLLDPQDEARVRVLVLDSATNAILDEFDVGSAGYDYYQGSIAVNDAGQVVIGYNRSGLDPATGKIGFYARAYRTLADGTLEETMGETLLKESLTNDYHNGSLFGQAAAGRQRWGDYSQVSVDPTNITKFWVIGEYAREYNLPEFGHPGGTGGSRWSTWIAAINAGAVPEPATWAMMIAGFGMVGFAMRRSPKVSVNFA